MPETDDKVGLIKSVKPEPIDWIEEMPNANNERVKRRLIDDKAQLRARVESADIVTDNRAGSPFNPGDLSNGGKNGVGGDVAAERGVAEDAAQHVAADNAAARIAEARATAMDSNGWGKPVGEAAAAKSNLLGDDAPAAGSAGLAGNPTTVKGKTAAAKGAPANGFVAPAGGDTGSDTPAT